MTSLKPAPLPPDYYKPKLAYVITRELGAGWMYAGRTLAEMFRTLKGDIQTEVDQSADDVESIDHWVIECRMMSDADVAALPEFEGWY